MGVSTRTGPAPGSSGKVRVFSGADGSLLRTVEEPSIFRFATDADFAGDVDGDGFDDVLVGTSMDDNMGLSRGSVRVYSGANGSLLHLFYGDTPGVPLGLDVSAAGDVDRDGFDDVIAGAYLSQFLDLDEAYAVVLSGADGSVLHRFETTNALARLIGGAVSGPGDVNADGYADLLVQTDEIYTVVFDIYGDFHFYETSGARLYSGRDGSLLEEFGNSLDGFMHRSTLSGAGDVNGDGSLDVLVGDFWGHQLAPQSGVVSVYAGAADSFIESCNGDGGDQMGCTDCPCSNNAVSGTIGGCVNSIGNSSRLLAFGAPSVSADSLRMELTGGTALTFAFLFSGDNLAPANAMNPCFGLNSGVTFAGFDGLRCAVGQVQRHGSRATNADGSVGVTTNGWGPPNGPFGGLIAQGGFVSGQTRHYQVIYREEATLGCMTGLNSSQALSGTFLP